MSQNLKVRDNSRSAMPETESLISACAWDKRAQVYSQLHIHAETLLPHGTRARAMLSGEQHCHVVEAFEMGIHGLSSGRCSSDRLHCQEGPV